MIQNPLELTQPILYQLLIYCFLIIRETFIVILGVPSLLIVL